MKKQIQSSSASPRPLEGRRIAISISGTDSLQSLGYSAEIINSITVDLARRLLALGATVVLGHNWRAGGVMEAVAKFALAYRSQNSTPKQPIILNYLAAPDQPSLSETERRDLAPFVRIETISWQEQKTRVLTFLRKLPLRERSTKTLIQSLIKRLASPDRSAARAQDLFAMRYKLCTACDARIAIGGRIDGYSGDAPGILEELWWSLTLKNPILLSTALGGLASAATNINSRSAQHILSDTKHPLAGAYLKDLCWKLARLRASPRTHKLRVVQDLNSEALLPAVSRLLAHTK